MYITLLCSGSLIRIIYNNPPSNGSFLPLFDGGLQYFSSSLFLFILCYFFKIITPTSLHSRGHVMAIIVRFIGCAVTQFARHVSSDVHMSDSIKLDENRHLCVT